MHIYLSTVFKYTFEVLPAYSAKFFHFTVFVSWSFLFCLKKSVFGGLNKPQNHYLPVLSAYQHCFSFGAILRPSDALWYRGAWWEARKVLLTNQKPEHSRYPEVVHHNKKLPGNLLWQSGCWSRGGNIVLNITTIAFKAGLDLILYRVCGCIVQIWTSMTKCSG